MAKFRTWKYRSTTIYPTCMRWNPNQGVYNYQWQYLGRFYAELVIMWKHCLWVWLLQCTHSSDFTALQISILLLTVFVSNVYYEPASYTMRLNSRIHKDTVPWPPYICTFIKWTLVYCEQQTHTQKYRSALMLNGSLWTMPSVMMQHWLIGKASPSRLYILPCVIKIVQSYYGNILSNIVHQAIWKLWQIHVGPVQFIQVVYRWLRKWQHKNRLGILWNASTMCHCNTEEVTFSALAQITPVIKSWTCNVALLHMSYNWNNNL